MATNLLTTAKYDYVSVEAVFSKIDRDYGMHKCNEGDVIEQVGEALALIGVVGEYEKAIAFMEVINHQAAIPGGGAIIIHQVARNNHFDGSNVKDAICPADVIAPLEKENETKYPVIIDCNGMPLTDYEVAYYRPYFDLIWEYELWQAPWATKFSPVRLATHTFFNSIQCEDLNLAENCRDQYQPIGRSALRLSFERGQIAVSYDRIKTDSNGYPMVPDEVRFIDACAAYCIMIAEKKAMYDRREGAANTYDRAEADWDKKCAKAGDYDMMPKGEDAMQNLVDIKNRLIPNVHAYYNFFGNLNRPEQRRFNNPDFRNKRYVKYGR